MFALSACAQFSAKRHGKIKFQGIRAKDESMVMYKQYKNALTYFYPKRKVLADGHTTVPLDIFENFVHSENINSLYDCLIHHAYRLCI